LIVSILKMYVCTVLGIAKPVIIGHGISHAVAFKNMIGIAEKCWRQN